MSHSPEPTRWVGLDIHKHYAVAAAVDREQNEVLAPRRIPNARLESWARKHLMPEDAVVIEMTVNTWKVYDLLAPHVQSVTVVHPPEVKVISKARVMTDNIAALKLARLHAAKLLSPIWVPPQEVRDLRAIVAQRLKLVNLRTQVKNRLHAVLHRHHLLPPEEGALFAPEQRGWWESLPLSPLEIFRIQSDLDTLAFADEQIMRLEKCLATVAAQDERVPLLVQLTGIGHILALTILAAIGTIDRFPTARHLVGYAGLGAAVKESGGKRWEGGITKSGRRDLRRAMVEAAHKAAQHHPYWKEQFQQREPHLGRNKAIVAIARKMLVAVWHILTKEEADRYASAHQVACALFAHAYKVGVTNLPGHHSAKSFTRLWLDRLGLGQNLTRIKWGSKWVTLPPSALPQGNTPKRKALLPVPSG
jgi:transposase